MPAVKHSLYLLPLLLSTLLTGCGKEQPVQAPKIGDTIADATFVGIDDSRLNLAAIQDKLVIVHFWATWCAPCRKEMPSLERLSQKLDPTKFALIGISVDEDVNLVKEFKLKYGIQFAKFIDIDKSLSTGHFGVSAYPETFIISRDHRLLRHMMGEHEWDTPAMLKVLNDGYSGVATKSGAYW
jgi:thiol-disulfide isomerase/thioredoxin